MRATADVVESGITPGLIAGPQEGIPPAMWMRALDLASGHRVSAAGALRRPALAHHDLIFDLRKSAGAQMSEHAAARFGPLHLTPRVVIVRRSVGHHKEGLPFSRDHRTVAAA